MEWFSASDVWLSRWSFEHALAAIYLIAFTVALNQFPALLGERGLLPVPRFVAATGMRRAPSLFQLRYSDGLLRAVAWTGIVVSAALLTGVPQQGPLGVSMAAWLLLWVLYLSIVNVGQTFYGFGWESLLVETGFLAAFLGNSHTRPPVLVLFLLRWLLFRVEFGAGLIKLRGDPCWRNLTCLDYHHETQPMPNPLSWWFHHLPKRVHRIEVFANHVTQLVVPWFLFAPERLSTIAAVIIVITQCWLVLSGNFSWLNALTITLGLAAIDGSVLAHVLPVHAPHTHVEPGWHEAVVIALTLLIAYLSVWPVRNMISRRQRMNASFNNLHLVNTYGAFGSVTRTRNEVVLEGSADGAAWLEYEFKGKPGDVRRLPRQFAPYHLRLDWLMWFAALSPAYAERWMSRLIDTLLVNDKPTLRLLARNPFPGEPPALVRARLYRYRFTTRSERRETGAWWHRTLVGEYRSPTARGSVPVSLDTTAHGGKT